MVRAYRSALPFFARATGVDVATGVDLATGPAPPDAASNRLRRRILAHDVAQNATKTKQMAVIDNTIFKANELIGSLRAQ